MVEGMGSVTGHGRSEGGTEEAVTRMITLPTVLPPTRQDHELK